MYWQDRFDYLLADQFRREVPLEVMAMSFNVTEEDIERRLWELGLADKPPKDTQDHRRKWTDEHKAHLRNHYGKTPTAEIAAHLGRTIAAIRSQARTLGLQQSKRGRE